MSLIEAAVRVGTFLENENIPYFVIGGLAVQHWGEPRMTHDVDVTVLVDEAELASFVDKVLRAFRPRICDARTFALKHRVTLVEVDEGVPVDISLGIPGYEEEAIQRACWVEFSDLGRLRLVSPEDLIIHKCVAGRPRDMEDVQGVLLRQRLQLDLEIVRRWLAEFQPLVDTHDPLEVFTQTLAQAKLALE